MRVIRSAGQNVSPSDDGRLFDQAFTDGLFEDATIVANGGNTISLSALYGIICGRDFTAEAQTISAVLPQTDTATGYVYVEFDTSSDDIITIGTALAPFTPTYENINTNGAVVQMVIAEYTASAVAVTSVTPTYVKASAGGVGSLAMIEASPATANHAVGTYLVYNGILYSVTSAIAIGETLVVGTNIAEAKVGDALSELKSGLTSLFKIVTVDFNNTSISANALVSVSKDFTLDEAYRPIAISSYNLSRMNGFFITNIAWGRNFVTIGGHNNSTATSFHGSVTVLCARTNTVS